MQAGWWDSLHPSLEDDDHGPVNSLICFPSRQRIHIGENFKKPPSCQARHQQRALSATTSGNPLVLRDRPSAVGPARVSLESPGARRGLRVLPARRAWGRLAHLVPPRMAPWGLRSPLCLCLAVIRAKAVSVKEVDSGNDIYGNPIKRIQYEIKQIKVTGAVAGLPRWAELWEGRESGGPQRRETLGRYPAFSRMPGSIPGQTHVQLTSLNLYLPGKLCGRAMVPSTKLFQKRVLFVSLDGERVVEPERPHGAGRSCRGTVRGCPSVAELARGSRRQESLATASGGPHWPRLCCGL